MNQPGEGGRTLRRAASQAGGNGGADATRAAALDFAEALAAWQPSVDEALITRLRTLFTDAEIIELGFAAGGFLMWGRLHRAFDVPASGPGYHAMLANESGLTERTP